MAENARLLSRRLAQVSKKDIILNKILKREKKVCFKYMKAHSYSTVGDWSELIEHVPSMQGPLGPISSLYAGDGRSVVICIHDRMSENRALQ